MATLVLQVAGAAIGSAFGPIGAVIGQAAGALAGGMVDRALFSSGRTVEGARLSTARISGADEGEAITRLYGSARIGGTLIWATRFTEHLSVERSGGKGGGGGKTTVESFSYSANFALGLCEGEIATLRRVWADGQLLDLSRVTMRVYTGSRSQLPDPLIAAKQGAVTVPAFRGLAYVVFENFALEHYGNRIPLMQFEVVRVTGALEHQIRAVTMIPGSTEHGYGDVPVSEETGFGEIRVINRNLSGAYTDWQASLDELQALCPNLEKVALVVSWFGTDMRAGDCRIVPGVEVNFRQGETTPWSVAGALRGDAHLISQRDGGPAYGGTPSDASVRQALHDLKRRGLKACLYPFIMMDVPQGNGLPDPYGAAQQDVYGWRGRVTCHPAPGQAGTPDRTSALRSQIDVFLHRSEGYRRMVLHYAGLAAEIGGIDLFLIGSELRGLTQLRADDNRFPFVDGLVTLAHDVRAVLGSGPRISYGADWSEYFGYQPQDGSGDVFFNLDPLWASSAIDAVAIDNYMPLSDWRDEDLRHGNPDGFTSSDDMLAMRRAITSGEGYDWFYASDEARRLRQRSPISDGAAQKPWVFRSKDLHGWWANRHYPRLGGVEQTNPTPWNAASKPIIFTELGCGAVDKGANRPSSFLDPKSSVSALPPFSNGMRSDSQQRRFLEAHLGHWASGGLVNPSDIFCWTWDARPYPAFPQKLSIWSDGNNWHTGHWLNGRLGMSNLRETIAAILTEHGFTQFDVSAVSGDLPGYVQGAVLSARQVLEPLLRSFLIDVVEDRGILRFLPRGNHAAPTTQLSVLADVENDPLWSETRGHVSDFSSEVILSCFDLANAYEQASFRSRSLDNASKRVTRIDLPAVLSQEQAQSLSENMLRDERLGRRQLRFSLSPQDCAFVPGDRVALSLGQTGTDGSSGPDGPVGSFQITRIEEGLMRHVEAREFLSPLMHRGGASQVPSRGEEDGSSGFHPVIVMMDLPRYHSQQQSGETQDFVKVAAFARPWKRIVAVASHSHDGFEPRALMERPARIGRLTRDLTSGVSGRIDHGSVIEARFAFGAFSSVGRQALLGGANRFALRAQNGSFEIGAFGEAVEFAPGEWRLSRLLRGLAGTEAEMAAGATSGTEIVMLDAAVIPLGVRATERGRPLNWIFEGLDVAGSTSPMRSFVGGSRALTPLSPVHLRARRVAGALQFSWLRRSREDDDDFNAAEIALDEPFERYRVTLSSGGVVLRSHAVDRPEFVYSAAMQSADAITAPQMLRATIEQMGRIIAHGQPASVDVAL